MVNLSIDIYMLLWLGWWNDWMRWHHDFTVDVVESRELSPIYFYSTALLVVRLLMSSSAGHELKENEGKHEKLHCYSFNG